MPTRIRRLGDSVSLLPAQSLRATAKCAYGLRKSGQEQLTDSYDEFPAFNLTRSGPQNRYSYLSAATDENACPSAVAKMDNTTGQ